MFDADSIRLGFLKKIVLLLKIQFGLISCDKLRSLISCDKLRSSMYFASIDNSFLLKLFLINSNLTSKPVIVISKFCSLIEKETVNEVVSSFIVVWTFEMFDADSIRLGFLKKIN